MESRLSLSGEAAGELAFGEEVIEGDSTRVEEARSSGEDTRIVVEDSEAGDCEDMNASAETVMRATTTFREAQCTPARATNSYILK